MCMVSNIVEYERDWINKRYPNVEPWIQPRITPIEPLDPLPFTPFVTNPLVTREELDEIKKQLEEFRELLKQAKIYDERTGQPDCSDKKEIVDFLRKLADKLEVEGLGDLLK